MWRKWLKSLSSWVVRGLWECIVCTLLHSSSVHIPLLGTQSLMSSLPFFPHFSQSLLVFPAFCYPFATFHFKVPILCLLLSFSLFSVVPSQTMKESLGCWGEGGAVRACLWLTALCGTGCLAFVPLPRKMEGTQRGGAVKGAVWKRGAVRGHSCVGVLVTLVFKQRTLQSEESLWPNVRTKSAHIVSWFMYLWTEDISCREWRWMLFHRVLWSSMYWLYTTKTAIYRVECAVMRLANWVTNQSTKSSLPLFIQILK